MAGVGMSERVKVEGRMDARPSISAELRHTYASHLAMAGVPMFVLAKNLGHADTRMTEKHYAHLSRDNLAEAIRAAAVSYEVTHRAATG